MTLLEARPEHLARALPLYDATDRSGALLPRAVLHGLQPGRVFVDREVDPRAAFVVTRFGFCALVGDESPEFHHGLARALGTPGGLGATYLLWYAPPPTWSGVLDGLVPAPVRRRERVRFEYVADRASYVGDQESCDAGFELRPLTAALLPATAPLKLDIASRFWTSAEDFLAHGLGVALLRGPDVVSVCYAACVVDGRAEVDVATSPSYRGHGYASVVAREFVRACVARGITPAWDAFTENEGSVRLAAKLGFQPRQRYSFYSFQTPLPLAP